MTVLLPFGYIVNAQTTLSHQSVTIQPHAETQIMPQTWVDTRNFFVNWELQAASKSKMKLTFNIYPDTDIKLVFQV